MTRLLLFFILLGTATASIGQSKEKKTMLWEISGNGLEKPSYLFGSVHLNDPRVFDLSDSVFYAIKSCKQFATEVDISALNSLIVNKYLSPILEKGESKEIQQSEVYDLELNGMPTILDAYLYRIAVNLGAKAFGLEKIDGLLDKVFENPKPAIKFDSKSNKYQSLVENYLNGEIDIEPEEDYLDEINFFERNDTQTNSFIELINKAPTFAVVGAGHLFWGNNILENLKLKGYTIRRVGQGKLSTELNEIYLKDNSDEWQSITDTQLGIKYKSNVISEIKTMKGIKFYTSLELDRGLVYISFFIPTNSDDAKRIMKTGTFETRKNKLDINVKSLIDNDSIKISEFSNFTKFGPQKGRITFKNGILVFQFVHGLSNSSIKHSNVNYFLNGLEYIPKPHAVWKSEIIPEYNLKVYFPEGIPFFETEVIIDSYDRGASKIKIKSYEDKNDSFQFTVQETPPGLIFPNPQKAAKESINSLINTNNAALIDFASTTEQGHIFTRAKLKDKKGSTYYVQSITQGTFTVLNVQKSKTGARNNAFFNGVEVLLPSKLTKSPDLVNFESAKISIQLPNNKSVNYTNELSEIHTAYNFLELGTSLDLSVERGGKYSEYLLSDSSFTQKNLFDKSLVDSLYSFRTFKYDSICPAFVVDYVNDSSFLMTTELQIYCNDHVALFTFQSPISTWKNGLIDSLIKDIKVEVAPNSLDYLTQRKAELLLNDLYSMDSSVFYNASNNLYSYDFLETDSLSKIFTLINSKLLDDDSLYSTKEKLIGKLSDLNVENSTQELDKIYSNTNKSTIQTAVLNSLSRKEDVESLELLFSLLEKPINNEIIPDYGLFQTLKDSVDLFVKYKSRIIQLMEKKVALGDGLTLFNKYLEFDSTGVISESEKQSLASIVKHEINDFILGENQDSDQNELTPLVEYMKFKTLPELEDKLYSKIEAGEDNYAKYLVCVNFLDEGKMPTEALVETVLLDSTQSYFLVNEFVEKDLDIPYSLLLKEKIIKQFAQSYFLDDFDFSSLVSIKKVKGKKKQTYFEVTLMSIDEEGYIFVLVGPIVGKGHIHNFQKFITTDYETYQLDDKSNVFKGYLKPE